MEFDVNKLSPDDRLFMVFNRGCFRRSVQLIISLNMEGWMQEVETQMNPDKVKKIKGLYRAIKKEQKKVLDLIPEPTQDDENTPEVQENGTKDLIKRFFKTLDVELALDSNDAVGEFMIYVSGFITALKVKHSPMPDVLKALYNYVFKVYFPWKITANEIVRKVYQNTVTEDKTLLKFISKSLRTMIQNIMSSHDVNVVSLCTFYLLKETNITYNIESVSKMIKDMKGVLNPNDDMEQLTYNVAKLMHGDDDALTFIDQVDSNGISKFGDILIKDAKRRISGNYMTSKLGQEVKNYGLCLGDDIFPDGGSMRLENLMVELASLTESEIQKYVGSNESVSYQLLPGDVGYLRETEKLPLCKILRKDNGFMTLAKYDNTSYLMFKLQGKDAIYGISFPATSIDGTRKAIQFERPSGTDYEMSSPMPDNSTEPTDTTDTTGTDTTNTDNTSESQPTEPPAPEPTGDTTTSETPAPAPAPTEPTETPEQNQETQATT